MNTPELARFEELLSRYLDASLEAAEEREFLGFLADEALATRFHEATRLDVEIAGVLAGSVPDEVMISLIWSDVIRSDQASAPVLVRQPAAGFPGRGGWTMRWRTTVWLAAAAVLAIFAGAMFHLRPHAAAPRAMVTANPAEGTRAGSVRGEVYLLRATGRERLTEGRVWRAGGTVETVGGRSRVMLTLQGGSKIELKGDSVLTVDPGSAASPLVLRKGMMVATVTMPPANGSLIFETDRATATVRGTAQFAMVAEPSGAYLIVTEGAVGLRRRSGGREVLIEAGYYGHVELGGQFYPFPIFRLPRELQEELPER